jgi:hypothetical protein
LLTASILLHFAAGYQYVDSYANCHCLIKTVMLDAEAEMRKFLSQKNGLAVFRGEGRIFAEHCQATLE